MQRNKQPKRDRRITREIHKLFWRGNLQDKPTLFLTYLGRIPAYAALNTFIPLASAYALQAILQRHFDKVGGYALLVVLLGIVYAVLSGIGSWAVAKNAVIGSEYVQRQVFANYLAKDYEFFTNTYFGALGSKATSLRDASNDYGEMVTAAIPKQLTIVITSVAIIAYQSVLLAIVTLLAMVLVLGFTIFMATYRLRYRREVSLASSRISGDIGDALTHGSTVKSFGMEHYEQQRLNGSLKAWSRAQYKSWVLYVPADVGRMLLVAISTAVLLLISAHLYQEQAISITIVLLIQLYVIKLIASTLDTAEIIKRYEQIMGTSYDPVRTMLLPSHVTDPVKPEKLPKKVNYELVLHDMSYRYDEAAENRYAIKDFNLTIQPGEKIGLVGYSGSGKTTLTKLLLRFMDVSHGSITLDAIDIRNLRQSDLRSIISYVPQEPLLFHRSIAENIAYAKPAASDTEIKRAAKLAYVNEFVKDLPKGYETHVGERGIKLSGGQRQRVAIARALLKDAPILVLDEATSALDSESEKYIQDALWRLMKDRTAIVVAHRLSTIQRMDRIVVMHEGRIVQVGSHKELLRDKTGIYAKLWAHQSGGYIGAGSSSG